MGGNPFPTTKSTWVSPSMIQAVIFPKCIYLNKCPNQPRNKTILHSVNTVLVSRCRDREDTRKWWEEIERSKTWSMRLKDYRRFRKKLMMMVLTRTIGALVKSMLSNLKQGCISNKLGLYWITNLRMKTSLKWREQSKKWMMTTVNSNLLTWIIKLDAVAQSKPRNQYVWTSPVKAIASIMKKA